MMSNEYNPSDFADVDSIDMEEGLGEKIPFEDNEKNPVRRSSTSIIDGLLETQPDDRPETFGVEDMGLANIMIGIKKFVNGISGPERDLGTGTPAIVNLGLGALDLSGLLDRQKSDSNRQQEPESSDDWEGADGIPKQERGI